MVDLLQPHAGELRQVVLRRPVELTPQKLPRPSVIGAAVKGQQLPHAPQQITSLFDHLVGGGEQRGWYGETNHFRSFQIND